MNQEESNQNKYNEASPAEAVEVLKSENIAVDGDTVVFYVQIEDEVDEKPDQLIGEETEDSLVDEMNRFYVDVVAVGNIVEHAKVGEKFFLHPKLMMSAVEFTAGGLKFAYVPGKLVTIRKTA